MDIQLNFINNSNDTNNSDVVIFQKNVATDFDELAIAWKVIRNCGRGWSHKFLFQKDFDIAIADSFGNISNLQSATHGQKWSSEHSNSGDILKIDNQPSNNPNELEIQNNLSNGSVDAQIYKNGKLLATKQGLSPQQKAVFQLKPTIWIGVVSQVNEGDSINSAIISNINTEFSLEGISKANIIMSGGGTGAEATPFNFTLSNIS